ncbi:hypothetical protein V6N11_067475 [Hibiscus sabdariffa]|uniref:Uncharacterized protein n=1 Tax=Hibiscus sabdariffa TaxID=183260 RepID=A0ABR2SRH2_9ROSI
MKLCFAIVDKNDSFWVHLLRQKYKVLEPCPSSIARSNYSHLWRSLTKVWSSFHGFILWSIGDGSLIWFWHVLWLPNLGRLVDWKLPNATINDNLLVKDMLIVAGDWNWPLLRQLLLLVVIPHIQNLLAPCSTVGSDRCTWSVGKNVLFSVKSTYTQLAKGSWDPKDSKWDAIWRSGSVAILSSLLTLLSLMVFFSVIAHLGANILWQLLLLIRAQRC